MTRSCSSGPVLLVQGFHTCSLSLSQPGSLSQPVTVPSAPPCDGTDGWQLLCQGSPSRLRCSLSQAAGRDTRTLL